MGGVYSLPKHQNRPPPPKTQKWVREDLTGGDFSGKQAIFDENLSKNKIEVNHKSIHITYSSPFWTIFIRSKAYLAHS